MYAMWSNCRTLLAFCLSLGKVLARDLVICEASRAK
jgi:hypothetical protein